MLRIDFDKPLNTFEVRDPMLATAREVAEDFDFHVRFVQPQQAAYDKHRFARDRKRIGNGKHKDWSMHWQPEPLGHNRPTTVGVVHVRSHYDPEALQFGGFEYAKFGDPEIMYRMVTFFTTDELTDDKVLIEMSPVPDADILKATYEALVKTYDAQGALLDAGQYSTLQTVPTVGD